MSLTTVLMKEEWVRDENFCLLLQLLASLVSLREAGIDRGERRRVPVWRYLLTLRSELVIGPQPRLLPDQVHGNAVLFEVRLYFFHVFLKRLVPACSPKVESFGVFICVY